MNKKIVKAIAIILAAVMAGGVLLIGIQVLFLR